MQNLTEKQIKNQWTEIKKEIKNRPLLAFLTGITLDQWNSYMLYTPPPVSEVERIREVIREDRTSKTSRIAKALGEIIGYREAKQYAKKIGISDTSIRDIIEGKKITAGYQLIDKLEIFINAINPEFELSIENSLTKEQLVCDEFIEIASDIRQISNDLLREAMNIIEVGRKMAVQENYLGEPIHPCRGLELSIEGLNELKDRVSSLFEVYINANDKNNKELN